MRSFIDTQTDQEQRYKLVQEIESKGIVSANVLAGIAKIPRHFFLDELHQEEAYNDNPVLIGFGQTISQPFTVAFQTQLLEIQQGEKVLEVGTGSGYQTALLLEMGAKVFSIERFQELSVKAQELLNALGYFPQLCWGDGSEGWLEFAPFDKILVTAGAPEIPQPLLYQLKIGGRLVIPIGENIQKMSRFTRTAHDDFYCEEFGNFRFVPLLKGVVKK